MLFACDFYTTKKLMQPLEWGGFMIFVMPTMKIEQPNTQLQGKGIIAHYNMSSS